MSVDGHRSRNLPYDEHALVSACVANKRADSDEHLERLANQFEEQGDALEFQGDLAGAVRNFDRSRELRAELVQRDESNAHRKRDLSISLTRLGRVYRKLGHLESAAQSFQESCALRSWLVERCPRDARCKAELARTHKKLREVEEEQACLKHAGTADSQAMHDANASP